MSTDTAPKVTVRKARFEDDLDADAEIEYIDGEYDVLVDGEVAGQVSQGTAPKGCYGHWRVGGHGFETRRQGVDYIVRRFAARNEA